MEPDRANASRVARVNDLAKFAFVRDGTRDGHDTDRKEVVGRA